MSAPNRHRVGRSQWSKWSEHARSVFNAVYGFMLHNPDLMRHPKQSALPRKFWQTTAWNAAWIAADAVDDAIPVRFLEVA